MKQIIFINSHPIQYFTPLYKYLNQQGLKTKAWFCSDQSIKGELDREFGMKMTWDIPMLEGYEYRFFKNFSWKPSHFNGFFGLINFGMFMRLLFIPKSVFVVHGYHYFTHLFILLLARLSGHTVCLRMEMPLMQENFKKGLLNAFRKKVLKYVVFWPVHHFLYIGSQNRSFYRSYGIPDKKLLFCPYSVDNDRFSKEKKKLKFQKITIRESLGIPEDHKIVLYSGKYIEKKKPMDLLKAFKQLNLSNCWLIMVGEGNLRPSMETYIAKHNLQQVILTGFVNQSKISNFYAISNVFVMSSTIGETWGLSVNEAINFDLPVIVSDMTGCSPDLVENGVNGYVYETGNIDALAAKMKDILTNADSIDHRYMQKVIDKYSYASVAECMSILVS